MYKNFTNLNFFAGNLEIIKNFKISMNPNISKYLRNFENFKKPKIEKLKIKLKFSVSTI